jgi:hypothetical protein
MRKPSPIAEALHFVLAMVVLAAAVFAAFYGVIRFGGLAVNAWFGLLADGLGLPRPAALAFSVIGGALTVYAVWWALLERRKHRR